MSNLLLSIQDACVRYHEKPVFEDLTFHIHDGSRIALVGRNGAGKSTLMRLVTNQLDIDGGERWEKPGLTIGYLKQDIVPQHGQTVASFITDGLAAEERELNQYKVDIVADALQLDLSAPLTRLSGGQLRRAGLGQALVEEPDILLLDEPTNHLDLDAIEWLEGYLQNYQGTLLCVSHDRAFLSNVTTQVFWLDRGQLKISPKGFKYFDDWSQMLLEQEERELQNRKQIVLQEVEWASRGVKARRKRNLRRLADMRVMRDKLKADQAAFRRATKTIKLEPIKDLDAQGKIVAEFYHVYKTFQDDDTHIPILEKFSLRLLRGDRIGILGKNGSGKTTFLKLLIGELMPDQGSVKRRKDLAFSYFDQKRSILKPDETLKRTLAPSGGDYIDVRGKQRHVCGYLKDFMFDPARVEDKVMHLSGGQKNRLMLAKILANPKSCLILDEPTNDLDMETLDMLEDILAQYQGTLIVVSHDRDFLDQTVTQIIAFEGEGKIERCIGGYSDYLAKKKQRKNAQVQKSAPVKKAERSLPSQAEEQTQKEIRPRMTYKLKYELEQLPGKISAQEELIAALNAQLTDNDFYTRDPGGFHQATKDLAAAQARLERYELRWLELEDMANQ